MMKGFLVVFLAPALWAQAPWVAPQTLLKSEFHCVLQIKAETKKTVRTTSPELPSATITVDQDFTLKITGRLEEWEEPSGTVEFRFFPEPKAEGKDGKFKAHATDVRPMSSTQTLIEGSTIVGMGNWYFGASAPGKEITAFPRDLSVLGKVVQSTYPPLPVGTERVPVQLVIIPRIEREFPSSKQPIMQFPKGLDLWALRKSKGPLSVAAEVRFDETSPEQDIKGFAQLTFELRPKGNATDSAPPR